MNYTIAKVQPAQFAAAYGIDQDGDRLVLVVRWMQELHPMFRSQRDCADQQAWLDEFARVVHQTSQRHRTDPVIWTCDAGEFAEWALGQ